MNKNIKEFLIIDPKSIYKEAKSNDIVDTLVSYEDIKDLSDKAETIYKRNLTLEDDK
jgi:hypothetical protein